MTLDGLKSPWPKTTFGQCRSSAARASPMAASIVSRPGMPSGTNSGLFRTTSIILSMVRHSMGSPWQTSGTGRRWKSASATATRSNNSKSPLCMLGSPSVSPGSLSITKPCTDEWKTRGPAPDCPAKTSTAPTDSGVSRRKTKSVYRLMTRRCPFFTAPQTLFANPTVSGSKPAASMSFSPLQASTASSNFAQSSSVRGPPTSEGEPSAVMVP
mmetsp:Transcript_86986/g.221503  ORF Transcript_86986/g.221503 Transcript_86986/m.221503 type:complete len:213 (+) Transcript_86986:462-1100(+)